MDARITAVSGVIVLIGSAVALMLGKGVLVGLALLAIAAFLIGSATIAHAIAHRRR